MEITKGDSVGDREKLLQDMSLLNTAMQALVCLIYSSSIMYFLFVSDKRGTSCVTACIPHICDDIIRTVYDHNLSFSNVLDGRVPVFSNAYERSDCCCNSNSF